VVKPANPRIRRFFVFKLLFKFFKTAQNFYGRIVAKNPWSGYLFCHKNLRRFLKMFLPSSFVAESWRNAIYKTKIPAKQRFDKLRFETLDMLFLF